MRLSTILYCLLTILIVALAMSLDRQQGTAAAGWMSLSTQSTLLAPTDARAGLDATDMPAASGQSQAPDPQLYQVQSFEAADLGITRPVGLAAPEESGLLFVLPATPADGTPPGLLRLNRNGDPLGLNQLAVDLPDPLNSTYQASSENLFFFDLRNTPELVGVKLGPYADRSPENQNTRRYNARAFGVRDPQGMTFDSANGQLYILDVGGPTPVVLRVTVNPGNSFDGDDVVREGRLKRIRLPELRDGTLRGIAYNPQNGHLYIMDVAAKALYELTGDGEIVATFDVADLNLTNPQGMVFAASADNTDDPANMNLFIADSGQTPDQIQGAEATETDPGTATPGPSVYLPFVVGPALANESATARAAAAAATDGDGQIVELSFEVAMAPTALQAASLVQTIDTSKTAWTPSSPDPAGIAYRPATGGLLISDSEVEEDHPDFQGVNVFESNTLGSLFDTCVTTAFSNEPTGAAVNPSNGHIFFSDDNNNAVYEVNLGSNGTYCDADDSVTLLNTLPFGSSDPEGLAYGNNRLFISDGINQEVYVVDLGADGVIGGSGLDADTLESQFDTFALGLRDTEGVEYNGASGTLYLVSTIGSDDYLVETTTSGTAINSYDLSFLGSEPRSGLAYGPGSQDPSVYSIYMASRGVDNGTDPDENDGKVYEISIGSPPVSPPTADFSATPTAGIASLTVDFTDLSTGSPDSWLWDFGDGNTSTMQFPSHSYDTPGTYTVGLTVSNSLGDDTEIKTDYITVDPPPAPVADFGADPLSGFAPLVVNFNDLSTGNPSTWSWDFGDGHTSNDQNPVHSYGTPGDYTVSLTVGNISGSDTMVKTDYVTAEAPPPPPDNAFYLSMLDNGTVDGLVYRDEDILWYDGSGWSLYFDGSDVGIGPEDIDALHVVDADTILMSFTSDANIAGLTVHEYDIVEFTATSLGEDTAGTFSIYFDGEDVGLTDDIDALHLLPDDTILISTDGNPTLAGVTELKDEDILLFTPTSLGANTSGTWSLYFDASDTDIASTSGGIDTEALMVADNGNIYVSTDLTVTLGGVTSEDEDVAGCSPTSLGDETVCTFAPALFFDGSVWALDANEINATSLPWVTPANTAPDVTITAPADGGEVLQGESVEFTGTADDAEDGDLSASLVWTSDLDGEIGTGASFSTAGLSVGSHTITAAVTDSGGLPGTAQVAVNVNPSTATLTGTVTLEGRTDHTAVLTVALYETGATTPSYSFTPSTDSTGEFTVDGIVPADYEIAVKHAQYLQQIVAVSLSIGSNSADLGELLAGDANDDNVVTSTDFSLLSISYNKQEGEAGYDGRADFTGNGVVSSTDFSLLSKNYNAAGAEPTN